MTAHVISRQDRDFKALHLRFKLLALFHLFGANYLKIETSNLSLTLTWNSGYNICFFALCPRSPVAPSPTEDHWGHWMSYPLSLCCMTPLTKHFPQKWRCTRCSPESVPPASYFNDNTRGGVPKTEPDGHHKVPAVQSGHLLSVPLFTLMKGYCWHVSCCLLLVLCWSSAWCQLRG